MKSWQTQDGQQIRLVMGGTVNIYLVSYAKRHLLIDAGYWLNSHSLARRLGHLQLKPGNLAALILTHTHFDHAGNAHRIQQAYGTQVVVHRNEAEFLRKGETTTVHGTRWFYRIITRSVSPLMRAYHYPTVDASLLVDEQFDLGEWGFHGFLLHTPGHSPGSMCVILNNEIALVGDTIFNISRRTVFPPIAAEKQRIQASWMKLLDTGCHTFLPAHGGEIARDRVEKDYARLEK